MTNEKLNVKRTTKYGIQLDDDSYRNTSEPVKKFLEGKLPCEVEVTEQEGKVITKVKPLGQRKVDESYSQKQENRQSAIDENARLRRILDCVLTSNQTFIAGLIKKEEVSTYANGLHNLVEMIDKDELNLKKKDE